SATGNTIGGTSVAGNVIAANADDGVHFEGVGVTDNLIQGNNIGTDLSGTQPLGNVGHGVRAIGSGPNTIGNLPGGPTGRGNRIAYNQGDGVAIILLQALASTRKAVLGNSIYSNGGLGIDLGDDGVTPNDAGDADTGPNMLQ